ncbi:MAG: hypothetical protein ACERKT_08860 [Acidobacteriota bacterium]
MTRSEQLHRAAGGLATAVGITTTLAPGPFLRQFGIKSDQTTGTAVWGWRMFGIRTALIGGLIVSGNPAARAAMIPVQAADQVTFALAARDPEIPTQAVNLARAISGTLILTGGLAAWLERRES